MPAPIRITADTTKIKKSILEIGKSLSNLGTKAKPVSILSKEEQEFTKRTAKDLTKTFGENRKEISKLIQAHAKLLSGSKEYRNTQKEITKQLREQKRLAGEIQRSGGRVPGMPGGGGSGGGGGLSGFLGPIGKVAGVVGLAAVAQGVASAHRYEGTIGDRIRLQGLGVSEKQQLGRGTKRANAEELAMVGLTQARLLERETSSVAVGGRRAGTREEVIRRAGLERGAGLEEGQLGGLVGSLSPIMGGSAASDTTLKAMATLIAGGVDDGLGPALDSIVDLLTVANDQGLSQVNAMLRVFTSSSQGGGRTPAQIARIFGNIDQALKQSSGEQNAFNQTAFANAGIGQGLIGATQLAITSGGLFGLDRKEAEGRFPKGQVDTMEKLGLFKGFDVRGEAILKQAKLSAGIDPNRSVSSITDPLELVGLNSMLNSQFGTTGTGGIESANAVREAIDNKTPAADLKKTLASILEKNEGPDSTKLRSIKESVSGTMEYTRLIKDSISTDLGANVSNIFNLLRQAQTKAIEAESGIMSGIKNAPGNLVKGSERAGGPFNFLQETQLKTMFGPLGMIKDLDITDNIMDKGREFITKGKQGLGTVGEDLAGGSNTLVDGLTSALKALAVQMGIANGMASKLDGSPHPRPVQAPVEDSRVR